MVLWVAFVANGTGLTDGSFGPAAYYTSDIPRWPQLFYGEDRLGVALHHPVLVAVGFVVAALLYFALLLRLDRHSRNDSTR